MRNFKYGPPCKFELKDLDLKDRIVKAYYFNAQTIDSDNDIISIDAYSKSITERGPKSDWPRVKHLFNHWDAAGKIMELGKDEKGGWFISKLGRHTVGKDTLLMYEDGIITEHSHGFEPVNTGNETIDGIEVRRVKEAILWEVTSLDKWGANMHTPVIKSMEDRNCWTKRIENLIKAFSSGKYSDETFELLEIQLKQIQELVRQYDMEAKPYKGWHSARVIEPNKFQSDSFRKKEITDGIIAIMGRLIGETTMTIQAYRFDANKFTVAEAKKWLKDHDIKYISFEPAEEEEPKQRATSLEAGRQLTLPKTDGYNRVKTINKLLNYEGIKIYSPSGRS